MNLSNLFLIKELCNLSLKLRLRQVNLLVYNDDDDDDDDRRNSIVVVLYIVVVVSEHWQTLRTDNGIASAQGHTFSGSARRRYMQSKNRCDV